MMAKYEGAYFCEVAGQVDADWYDDAISNLLGQEEPPHDLLELQFAQLLNAEVSIDRDRCVWVVGSCWMSQPLIDQACKAIDAGI